VIVSRTQNGSVKPYTPESIAVLTAIECIRRRPGMYVGDVTDGTGLRQLLWECVGYTLGEHLARRATRLRVDVDDIGCITVEDDGPGTPVLSTPGQDGSALELVFERFHEGRACDPPHAHWGDVLRGVGLIAVTALSARLEVESRYAGGLWRAVFERGVRVAPVARHGSASRSGTRLRFRPDETIFGTSRIDVEAVEARLGELSWLFPLLAIEWRGRTLPGHKAGPACWVRSIAGDGLEADSVFAATRVIDDVHVDVAVGWRRVAGSNVRCFVNGSETTCGTHLAGFWEALIECAFGIGCNATPSVIREVLERGLVAVVHVGLMSPQFACPTTDKLVTPFVRPAVRRVIKDALPAFVRARPELRQMLCAKLHVE
jgi:DNA gyrase subunit B